MKYTCAVLGAFCLNFMLLLPTYNTSFAQETAITVAGNAEFAKATFSSDSKTLATADWAGRIQIWDISSGKATLVSSFQAHQDLAWDIAFLPDGKTVASCGGDSDIVLWSLPTGRKLSALKGHKGPVRCIDISKDGNMLASASLDGSVRLWRINTGIEQKTLSLPNARPLWSVAISPDCKLIAAGTQGNGIVVWDTVHGKEFAKFDMKGVIMSIKFSPDGAKLISASTEEAPRLWDLQTKKMIRTFQGHEKGVPCLALSRDGSLLVTGSSDSKIKYWAVDTGKEITSRTHLGMVNGVVLSSDNKLLASASHDKTVVI